MDLRRKSQLLLAVMAFWLVAGFLAMLKPGGFTRFLFLTATLSLFGYMTWCIRAANKRDRMDPDSPLRRGPDPFLSGKTNHRIITRH
jgi:hypothetical protein